jgi:hypothetical protein
MAHLLLYGNGWSQRWELAEGEEERARRSLEQVGGEGTGRFLIVDAGTDTRAMLVVAWELVAAAVVLDEDATHPDPGTGRYA